jgi:hypothetical protein
MGQTYIMRGEGFAVGVPGYHIVLYEAYEFICSTVKLDESVLLNVVCE